jgi:hypothetical protein
LWIGAFDQTDGLGFWKIDGFHGLNPRAKMVTALKMLISDSSVLQRARGIYCRNIPRLAWYVAESQEMCNTHCISIRRHNTQTFQEKPT